MERIVLFKWKCVIKWNRASSSSENAPNVVAPAAKIFVDASKRFLVVIPAMSK